MKLQPPEHFDLAAAWILRYSPRLGLCQHQTQRRRSVDVGAQRGRSRRQLRTDIAKRRTGVDEGRVSMVLCGLLVLDVHRAENFQGGLAPMPRRVGRCIIKRREEFVHRVIGDRKLFLLFWGSQPCACALTLEVVAKVVIEDGLPALDRSCGRIIVR